jgi:hypothetical protein
MRQSVLNLQRLVEDLLQILKDGDVIDHEGSAGVERRFLHLRLVGTGESDDGNVRRAGILLEARNGFANLVPLWFEIRHNEQRFFVFGLLEESSGICNRLHAVTEVLHAIDQLPARQQPFIQEQRERFLHRPTDCATRGQIAKIFSSASPDAGLRCAQVILRLKLIAFSSVLLVLASCGDSPPKTPGQGTYGQITNVAAKYVARKRPPETLAFNPAAALTWVRTELSPATLFRTTNNYAAFFTELERYGLGAPSHAAFSTRNGPRAFRNGERLEPSSMEENWVLVWFAGARGWTNGDSPCVVYLQHKPTQMVLETNGLHFYFPGPAGDIVLLPLYGSHRPPAEGQHFPLTFAGKKVQTWQWAKVLTREPLMRIRYWASALREFPLYCDETFSVDRSTDSVTTRQKFDYHAINDDWGTKHLKLNPVSPTLGPVLKDPQFPVKFSRNVLDLEMPTPFGLYMAAEGETPLEATFFVLQHINEAGHATVVTNASDRPGKDAWARWLPRDDCIELARQAYRSSDVDRYNYLCYQFARTFTQQRRRAERGVTTNPVRLIPSGAPTPFVAGLERESGGPSPPLLQISEDRPHMWPVVALDEKGMLGHVKTRSNHAPSQTERVAINWNTESLLFFP